MKRWKKLILLFCCANLAIAPEHTIRPPTDIQCLAFVTYDEARGEPVKGRKAVLEAVRTRMKLQGKTACEIVAQPKQFSGYKRYSFYYVDEKMLTMAVEADKIASSVKGCPYFHATRVQPKWAENMVKCGTIGKHTFLKEKRK